MTYHTQGESQHTIFRTLFAISNDVQHPKLAIQWRILIKSALSRDVRLKIAPYPGMGKGFFVTDIVSNNPPGFHVIFRHAYLGKGMLLIGSQSLDVYSCRITHLILLQGNLIYCLLFVTDVNYLQITERKCQKMVTFWLRLSAINL